VVEEAAAARAYETSHRVGVVKVGRGSVSSGPVLSYRASTCVVGRSFTNKPNRSNYMEQELLVVK
jgi:hypothetical protein